MRKEAISYLGNYPVDLILSVGGDDLVERLANKVSGSDANKNGRDFELMFGVSRTIIEAANISKQLRNGIDLPELNAYCFWDRPIALVDDFYLYGVSEHFLAQLKRGSFNWAEVYNDICLQRDMDSEIGLLNAYQVVAGNDSDARTARAAIRAEGWVDVQVSLFEGHTEFNRLVADNPDLGTALEEITGSSRLVDQETAFETFFYEYWKTSHLQLFVRHHAACAARKEDFIPPLVRSPVLDYLSEALANNYIGGEARIVGQMLRLTKSGVMHTYLLPSDSEIHNLLIWLDERITDFGDVTAFIESEGWERAIR